MKSLQRKALTSVIAMLLGLLVTGPIATESSQAAGTITKTVVVRGADNELLPNALVSVGYPDETDPLGWRLTDPVTTNSSGQAIITGLPVIDYGELTVQPAVGDVANSLGFANSSSDTLLGDFNLDVSSIYYIKLAPATVRLNLKYSNGSAAPVRTGVYWPSDSTQNKWFSPNLLREGAFGINIHSSLNCTTNEGNWRIAYRYYSEDSGDVTDNAISMIATNCTSSRTLTLKDIVTNTDHPKDGSVWQVSSRKVNFKYTIVSPLDQSKALDYSYNAGLRICPVVSGNADNCFGVGAEGVVGGPDGTYKLVADAGSSGFASTDFTAIISNNGATVSLKVGYPASGTDVPIVNGRAIFATGVPNLSGRITKPNGDTITLTDNQGFDVQLLKKDEDDNYQGVSGAWSQGVYGFSISQVGEYKIEIRPQGLPQYVATQSPVITVTNSGGIKLSWDGGTAATTLSRNIALAVPNVILNILNPKTSAQMTSGWVTIENLNSGDQRIGWYGNLDISSQYPGVAAGKFIDGKYLLTVNPPQGNQAIEGLASKQYVLAVSGSGTAFVMRKGNSSTGETLTAGVGGVFTLTAGAANVVGRFLDSAGQPVVSNRTSWTNVCLQKLQSNGINWDWLTCTQTSTTGGFSISATEVGTYRVSIEPQGRSDIATTILGNFVLTSENLATLTQDYGNVTAASPTLKIRIREVDGTTNIKNAGLEVRKDNEFITWVNTQQAGVSAVNLANAGTYQFIVNPTSATPNSTRKLYTVTATAGVGGAISASIEGVTPDANGISTLYLGAAQIKGRVLVPASQGDTATANSWVVAVDKATNQEMWQFGTNSSQDGSFAMSLPAGNYTIFARAPYGDVSVGNSDPIGNIAIAADGAVTITGAAASASLTAANFTIRLQNPYWSGKVLNPSGTAGISDARVCLNAVVAGTQFWNCANTDSQGRWAMGKPAGFTDFGLNDQLQIAENQNAQFSMATYTGKTAIEGAGFMHGGAAIDLLLPAPNFQVKIVYGTNSTPAKNLWVNVNSLTGVWLGGSSTDANGFARFRVADLTKGVQVNVDPSNNSEVSAVAASTMKTYQDNQMVSPLVTGTPSTFFDTITLAVPNIRGFVSNPGTTTKVANSWVELIDSNGRWLGGSNTNSDGYFALNAPSNASYRINVNPPWGGNTTATNHSYDVAVNVSGVVTTLTDKTTNLAVETSTVGTGPGYSLTLGTPSVIGKVKDPTGTYVQNSWVVPINASNIQLWELGSNSRGELGSFSMAVPNGSYKIQARAPWNSSTYGPAAGCSVTIANGAVTTTAGGCVQSDRSLILTLRSPNFTVIVRDSSGTPLQNANVGLGIGSWNANAQTDANGLASLFVDPAEINSVNNGKIVGAQNMWMWIDPPYGNSTVVRSQCYSGQAGTACATLGQVTPGDGTFSNPQIVTRLAAPNTSVYVKLPNGSTSAGANAWVTILSIQKNGSGQVIGRNWIAGSNTDSDGKATFNLSDTSTAFAIEIEAPWDQRGLYAGNSFDSNTAGLTFANVNGQNFSLRTPNLTLNAKVSDGSSAISGGWVSVENVSVSDTPTSWVGGYGLDQNGKVSLTLAANGRFKVTINPAPGVVGVATPCIVTTNGISVVSAVTGAPTCVLASTTLTVKLATGNVVGTVSGPSGAVVGAIVTAKISGSSDTATVQVTSTDKNGTYNLQLDSAQVWDISVTPVNTPSDPVRLQSNAVTSRTITGGVNTINVALIAVV